LVARYKKIVMKRVGPGGWGCPCCAPPPGDPMRKKIHKIGRKIDDRMAIEEGLEYAEIDSELEEEESWEKWDQYMEDMCMLDLNKKID